MKKYQQILLGLAIALAGTSTAQARDSVGFSISFGAPVYYAPPPVYYAPPPVVYHAPAPAYYSYYGPPTVRYVYEPRHRHHQHRYDWHERRDWGHGKHRHWRKHDH